MQKYVHNTVEGNNDYDEQPWFRHVDFPFVMTWFSFLAYLEMLYKSFGMQYQELQDQSNEINLKQNVHSMTPKLSGRLLYNLNLKMTQQSILYSTC